MKSNKISVSDIALVGMLVAIIEVAKLSLSWLPNVELVTFLIIIFTIYFSKKMFFVIPAFVLIEGVIYGFGIWWIMYLYIWPFLAIISWIFRKNDSNIIWAIISGAYGLFFGLFCSIPYFVIGAIDGGLAGGISSLVTWWIAGIPYDILHGISNFFIMLILYRPMKTVMKSASKHFK